MEATLQKVQQELKSDEWELRVDGLKALLSVPVPKSRLLGEAVGMGVATNAAEPHRVPRWNFGAVLVNGEIRFEDGVARVLLNRPPFLPVSLPALPRGVRLRSPCSRATFPPPPASRTKRERELNE